MTDLISIAEAATYLGVSKATLRNWDREGKLPARRHPLNDYRCYHLDDLRRLRSQLSLIDDTPARPAPALVHSISDAKSAKRLVSKLHAALRNHDGDSNLLHRFDELTKLLFVKIVRDRALESEADVAGVQSQPTTVERWKSEYSRLVKRHAAWIPEKFRALGSSDAALQECAEILDTVSFEGERFDVKGLAYEEVIKGTFDKSDNQQFFTPPQIVAFMVEMLRSDLRGKIMDPACGTGGFLVELAKNPDSNRTLLGAEIDERLAWVSAINILAHGARDFEVKHLAGAGSLGRGLDNLSGEIDAILTNPPFGSDLTDEATLARYVLGQGRSSRRRGILFLERCHELLREGGVLGIVLDEGVLNLASASDVRRFVLEHFEIQAIVSLPDTAFLPYASVAASILFLRKSSRGHRNSPVFFARAEAVGRRANGDEDFIYETDGTKRLNSDLPEIVTKWNEIRRGQAIAATEQWYTADVSQQLQREKEFRLDFRFHHPSREDSSRLLEASRYPLSPLSDLCEEVNDSVIPSTSLGDDAILYTGLAHIEARSGRVSQEPTPAASLKSAVKAYEPGDILFARMRPGLRKVAYVAFPEGGYCSPECVVLRVRRDDAGEAVFDPELLAAVLRSDLVFGQILHLVAGIGRPRLNVTDLRRVQIPVPPREVQVALLQQHRAHLKTAQELSLQAIQMQARATAVEVGAVHSLSREIAGGSLE